MTVNYKSADHEKKTADRQFRKGTPIQFYTDDEQIAAIDEWSKQHPGKPLTRSEALRRLTALALDSEAKKRGRK